MCNVIEVILQLLGLRMMRTRGKEAAGLLITFTTQAFTFWKTLLVSRVKRKCVCVCVCARVHASFDPLPAALWCIMTWLRVERLSSPLS